MQETASSFCTGGVEIDSSLLSEVLPLTSKAFDPWSAAPPPRLVTGRCLLGTGGEAFTYTGRVVKPF